MNRTQTLVTVIVVIIIVGIGVFFTRGKGGESNGTATTTPTTTSETSSKMMAGASAILVQDQKPGNSVSVAIAVLANPGFVVITRSGTALGTSSLLPQGETKNMSIALSAATKDGDDMEARLYIDNGDGVFDIATDAPAKDSIENNPIAATFKIDADASDVSVDIAL